MNRIRLWSIILVACFGPVFFAACKEESALPDKGYAEAGAGAGSGANLNKQNAVPDKEAEIQRGKTLFVKASCWGCHPHGDNSMNFDKPLKGPTFEKKYESDQSIIDFVRQGSPERGMPPFPEEKLSDGDLKTIIVYIRSLSVH